jgi:hypothetical protein
MKWLPGVPSVAPFDGDELYETVQTKITSVPFQETDMIAQTPDLYVTNAFSGAYIVHRFLGPDQPLQNSNDLPTSVVVPTRGYSTMWSADTSYTLGTDVLIYANDGAPPEVTSMPATGPINVMPLNMANSDPLDSAGTHIASTFGVPPWLYHFLLLERHPDTSMDNVSQSVQIYRGLNGSASLQIKRILSLEAAPLESSSARPFVTPPLDFDPTALRLYYQISHKMSPIHPAEYNDFGSIIDHIARVVRSVATPLATIIGAIQPELLPVAELVAEGVNLGSQGVSALVKLGRRPLPKAQVRPQVRPRPQPNKNTKARVVVRRR